MKRLLFFIVIFLLLAVSPLFAAGQQFNMRKPLTVDQDLIIRTADISEYALFYPVEIDGFPMEVIAVKAPDNTIRTAFNACIVCYTLGKGYYVQKRSVLICQQCGDNFTMDSVDTGIEDCHPVPISSANKTVTASTITISKEYLKQAKAMFIKMKEEAD